MTVRPVGKYLRWLCLAAYISYQIYTIVRGTKIINYEEGEMAGIFICESPNDPVLTQCTGLDDSTTCVNGVQCIRSSCGRPLFPRIGVSYAGTTDPFDAESATSTQSTMTVLSILYSLVPYILRMFFITHFLAMGNVVPLTRLGLMMFVSLVNDALLKNIVKQHRPTGSCLYFHSYGMPSGHAANSIGLLTCMLLELFMYHPDMFLKRSSMTTTSDAYKVDTEPELLSVFAWGYGWQAQSSTGGSNVLESTIISFREDHVEDACMERSLLPEATVSDPTLFKIIHIQEQEGWQLKSKGMHHYRAFLWTILLLPVPISRVCLYDHTPMQVLTGSFVGALLGSVWHVCIIRRALFRPGTFNGREAMEYFVKSRFGKWIGLNLGAGGGIIQVPR